MQEKVFILTFRNEFFPEPKQLVGFLDGTRAETAREHLSDHYNRLQANGTSQDAVDNEWAGILRTSGVPEDRYFKIDLSRYSNVAFEVKEIALLV